MQQLEHQIKHYPQSQIPIIADYVQETVIYFLQFLMENDRNTCIIDIGSLVDGVVDNIIDVIAASWTRMLWSLLPLQENWKL